MACCSRGTLVASSSSSTRWSGGAEGSLRTRSWARPRRCFQVRAVKAEECNEEECAPAKEVGKVSVDWLAGDKTKVKGTYPPVSGRKFTGYVEKDSAGQTNIYAVEPPVYVAESAISTGSAGASSEGSETTLVIIGGLTIVALVGAGIVLSSNARGGSTSREADYTGPPLSYYINKFQQPQATTAAALIVNVPPQAPALKSSDTTDQAVPVSSDTIAQEAPLTTAQEGPSTIEQGT